MKKILTQAVFFLALFGVIWVVLNVGIHKKENYLLRLKPSQIAAVTIRQNDSVVELSQILSPDGPAWHVREEDRSAPADDKSVQTLLAVICRIAMVERFPVSDFASKESADRIGMGSLAELSVQLKSGKTILLKLGREAPSGTETYAAVSTEPDAIFTIPNSFEKRLLPDFMGLKSRQVLPLASANRVVVTFGDIPLTLVSREGQWHTEGGRLSENQAPGLVHVLRGLAYINYFPKVPEDGLADYGFGLPDITVMLTGADGSQRSYDLSRYNGRFYFCLHAPGPQDVLIITEQSGRALWLALKKFVSHP